MIDRVGQVWEFEFGQIVLFLRSESPSGGSTLHAGIILDAGAISAIRSPGDWDTGYSEHDPCHWEELGNRRRIV